MTMPEGDGFDFDQMAESITDAPDPIVPNVEEGAKVDPDIRAGIIDNLARIGPGTRRQRRKAAETKPPKEKAPLPPRRRGSLVKPLEQMYGAIGLGLMPFDQVCATAVMNAAPQCAETLDQLAYENDAVRRVLISLITTSTIGQVLMAHAPILMAIMMHHVPAVRDGFGGALGKATAQEAEQYLRDNGGNVA